MDRLPFITGSRAYGTPHPNSDVDIVMLVTDDDITKLKQVFPIFRDWKDGHFTFWSGKVNLICVGMDILYDKWKVGTDELIDQGPVTRDEAKKHFQMLGLTNEVSDDATRERWIEDLQRD